MLRKENKNPYWGGQNEEKENGWWNDYWSNKRSPTEDGWDHCSGGIPYAVGTDWIPYRY